MTLASKMSENLRYDRVQLCRGCGGMLLAVSQAPHDCGPKYHGMLYCTPRTPDKAHTRFD